MSKTNFTDLLEAQRCIAKLFPECVLVGGTATALHCHHRVSFDADSVLIDLRNNYESCLNKLEELAGWKTNRIRPPVLILGNLNGVDIGIRQLRREIPLETTDIQGIKVPTIEEMTRIKAFLIIQRNTTRDFLDFIALCDWMSGDQLESGMKLFDKCYPQDDDCFSMSEQLCYILYNPKPHDLDCTDLTSYRHLLPRYTWSYIESRCKEVADMLFDRVENERGN